jgi:hypothetical protein
MFCFEDAGVLSAIFFSGLGTAAMWFGYMIIGYFSLLQFVRFV